MFVDRVVTGVVTVWLRSPRVVQGVGRFYQYKPAGLMDVFQMGIVVAQVGVRSEPLPFISVVACRLCPSLQEQDH